MKILRRLSRVGDAGDRERAADGEVAQVRQRGGAEHLADVGVGQRVLDRHDQVVGRAVEALHERRRHAMLAGLDVDLRRLHRQAVGILLVHARVDVHQRDALAVDRDFDLLAAIRAAEQVAGRSHVQHDLEHVVAVGREHVQHRHAAARAERRAFDVAHLRRGARHLPGGRGRRRVAIADREAADLAGRAQVAFHQRRRDRLRVGDVVEAVADGVGAAGTALTSTSTPSRSFTARCVLGAIQALRRTPARIRIERGRAIDARLERVDQRVDRRGVGTLAPAGGIMPARSLRIIFSATSRVIGDVGGVERLATTGRGPVLVAIVVAGRRSTA